MVAGTNSVGLKGYSQYTVMRGLEPSSGSCVLVLSGEDGIYYVHCDGFESSKGPLSYSIGIPIANFSASDFVQFHPEYLDSQQIQLAGGVSGSDIRLVITILDISGNAALVHTNTVHLPPESSVQLMGRILNAGRQLDFLSVVSLSITIFQDMNLSGYDGFLILSVIDKTVRKLSWQAPSPCLAMAALECLYCASKWALEAKVYNWHKGLEIMSLLIIWLTRTAGLRTTPMTQMQLIHCSALANNIYFIWKNKNSDSGEVSALITTALNFLRISYFQASLRLWNVGQPFVQMPDGFAFKKSLAELEGTSYSIGTEFMGLTLMPVQNVVSFSDLIPQNVGFENSLISVVMYKVYEPQLAPANLAIITALVTVDLSFSTSLETRTPSISQLILTTPIIISLVYNTTNYSPEIQKKIVSDRLIRCIWWNANETSGAGEWVDTGCSVESIQSSEGLSGQFIGIGTVQCSCLQPATFAAELDLAAVSTLHFFPTVSLVRWDLDTPNNLDEIVVAAGEEVRLRIVAFSVTDTPWKSTAAATAPSSLHLFIGNKMIDVSKSTGAWVSLPAVVETTSNLQYFQKTEWILTVSSAWTLAFSGNISNGRDESIHALLSGETSGDKTRSWILRILDCEILVGKGDNLEFISAKYKTSSRLIFAINPFLPKLGSIPAPSKPSRAQWTCSNGRYCSKELDKLAGGTRLKIGRMIRVLGNASVVQQIRQMGGSLLDVAGQNPGRISAVSSSYNVLDLNLHMDSGAAEICVVLHDEAIC